MTRPRDALSAIARKWGCELDGDRLLLRAGTHQGLYDLQQLVLADLTDAGYAAHPSPAGFVGDQACMALTAVRMDEP